VSGREKRLCASRAAFFQCGATARCLPSRASRVRVPSPAPDRMNSGFVASSENTASRVSPPPFCRAHSGRLAVKWHFAPSDWRFLPESRLSCCRSSAVDGMVCHIRHQAALSPGAGPPEHGGRGQPFCPRKPSVGMVGSRRRYRLDIQAGHRGWLNLDHDVLPAHQLDARSPVDPTPPIAPDQRKRTDN
jgi:hypothetical protein